MYCVLAGVSRESLCNEDGDSMDLWKVTAYMYDTQNLNSEAGSILATNWCECLKTFNSYIIETLIIPFVLVIEWWYLQMHGHKWKWLL